MIILTAAVPSLSVAVETWVGIVGVLTFIGVIMAVVLLSEETYIGAIAVGVAWLIMVSVASGAVLLSHHAAWVDYDREHPSTTTIPIASR